MKILIYGAGVIGCELAHMLCKKNDVTLLARGRWKETIDKNGLVIRIHAGVGMTVGGYDAPPVASISEEIECGLCGNGLPPDLGEPDGTACVPIPEWRKDK